MGIQNTGYQWSVISGTAVGTATLTSRSTFVKSLFLPASATGTIALCDSSSGTSTTSITVVNDTVDFPTLIPLEINFKEGLSYVVSGTTNAVLIYN